MCYGFGGIVLWNGTILFGPPDENGDVSHSPIIGGADAGGLLHPDYCVMRLLAARRYVSFGFPTWTEESFHWDEDGTLPYWLNEEETKERIVKLFERVTPIWWAAEKQIISARAEYNRVYEKNGWLDRHVPSPDPKDVNALMDLRRNRIYTALVNMRAELSKIPGYIGATD